MNDATRTAPVRPAGIRPEDARVGRLVRYYPVLGRPEFRLTPIRSEAWALGDGTLVCKVAGVTGGVALRNLDLVPEATV